jgi:hypothetical protein
MSLRDWFVEEWASSLNEVDMSWARSDAARDRGEHWLADEIAKDRAYHDGKQITLMKVARELGYFPEDLRRDANDAFMELKKARSVPQIPERALKLADLVD